MAENTEKLGEKAANMGENGRFLVILGRQPEISVAELEAQGWTVRKLESEKWAVALVERGQTGVEHVSEPQNVAGAEDDVTEVNEEIVGVRENSAEREENSKEDLLDIRRFGGLIKTGVAIEVPPLEYLQRLPEGKVTFGLSDYNRGATGRAVAREAIQLKRDLHSRGRSARVVESTEAVLPVATSLHNGLSGKNPRKVELMYFGKNWYRVTGVQDIDAYAKRDQNRPARDAKIGMLPPKLAQVLINLAGALPPRARILDPFCGTGVVLQEAILMGYRAYGTDIDPRMVKYSQRNLDWLLENISSASINSFLGDARSRPSLWGSRAPSRQQPAKAPKKEFIEAPERFHNQFFQRHLPAEPGREHGPEQSEGIRSREAHRFLKKSDYEISPGDATNCLWEQPIDAVVTEGYLGEPMSRVPTEVELKRQKQICAEIALGFLRNLRLQIRSGTVVVMCLPAWRRENGEFERLKILDEIADLGYNVSNKTREGLIYHRVNQIVARDIIILRKK